MSMVNPDLVIRECARAWALTPSAVTGDSRNRRVVQARWAAVYILHQSGMTQDDIGLHLGGRDHSTISHALHKTLEAMADDESHKQKLFRLAGVCGVSAGEVIPLVGRVSEHHAYRVLRKALGDIETARASILAALSLLPECETTEDIGHD